MAGMSRHSGARITDTEHLQQSITDILSTPIGSRVHRRDYGSRLPRLIDRPINPALRSELVAATAEALRRWEPRIKLQRVQIDAAGADGGLQLSLTAAAVGLQAEPIELHGILIEANP
ncbi:MAG: phage baseplate protein [Aphanocapsa feldmannii 277cI]|uniref:Phage baseplate protein n=1 Tax=Aphanocapsa feldmannii 277cI TaxID=2507554 RepID=A0A524RVZ1_9CHRO|nr:MAG: phage baseplate protein [Aphanocapsa feldmannii 277cI]